VEQYQVPASDPVDCVQEIFEVQVAEACRPISIGRAVEGALDEQHLRRQSLGLVFKDPGATVGAVGEHVGLDLFGDDLSLVAAASDLLAFIGEFNRDSEREIHIHGGIHSGMVVTGGMEGTRCPRG